MADAPDISELPFPPAPTDSPAVFNVKAFEVVASLDNFIVEVNGLVDWMNENIPH